MRTIKIAGSYSGKISTGPYENANPGFFVEEIIENCNLNDDEIFSRQRELYERSYQNFRQAEEKAVVERINKERQDFRFYDAPWGKVVPSVTSIINFDADIAIPPHELAQYASWGNIYHALVTEYWKTGQWKSPEDLEGIWADYVIVKKGSLCLELSGIDFPAYLQKYPFDCKGYDVTVYNEEHQYAGKIDFWGLDGGVETMADAKRTPDKTKHFLQTAAYCKARPIQGPWPEKFKKMMLVPLQNTTQQGFSKPQVSTEIDRYFEVFLDKRKKFRQRYGV